MKLRDALAITVGTERRYRRPLWDNWLPGPHDPYEIVETTLDDLDATDYEVEPEP